jgi:glutaconate CoA-transferase subunit A
MSKIVSARDALADLHDGMQLATGGWIFGNQPMALVREVIRKGTKNLRLVPAPGSVAPDMLVGAGAVVDISCVFISFEQFGLAPNFRRAAEAGTIRVREMDGPGIAGGLRAGACDLPYMLVPDLGTDLPRVNPETYRALPHTPGERRMLSVPAIQPDFVLLHGQQADHLGNVQFHGACFFDALLAQAGKKVVVSVDRIVDTATIRKNSRLTKLPAAFVHAVVEVPFGAHPSSSAASYELDEEHLREYVKASGSAATFEAYLDRFVRRPTSQEDYLGLLGKEHLASLNVSPAA